jgi:hypothetical protein
MAENLRVHYGMADPTHSSVCGIYLLDEMEEWQRFTDLAARALDCLAGSSTHFEMAVHLRSIAQHRDCDKLQLRRPRPRQRHE